MEAVAEDKTQSTHKGEARWYAVYVSSRAEKKVNLEFSQKGIESFVPLKKSLRKWSDRKKWVDLPLIPGYCFVKINFKFYLSVLQTNHVVGFVRFEGKPAVIQDNQIDFLKRMLKQTDYFWEITKEKLLPGQKVEIIAGPFIGMEAELIAMKGKKRVGVRIEQINNTLLVDIPMEDVTAIS
jgi:transcription antitermination factor NusG